MSLTISPAFPTVAKPVRVAFSVAGGANWVRLWCTDAPPGSALRAKLDQSSASRVEEFAGGATTTWEFQGDVPGAYVFAVQEYARGGVTFGGGFKADPRGFQTETPVGSETVAAIKFGQRATQKVGAGADTATLVLWVWGDTIRATTIEQHGELSPALIGPSSPKAKTAVLNASVAAAVAALSDADASTVMGNPGFVSDNIISKLNAHLTQGGVHNANDSDNHVSTAYGSAASGPSLVQTCAKLLQKLDQHERNDDGLGGGTGSKAYHVPSGTNRADFFNALVASPPGDLAGCCAALADCWRSYEAHRTSSVHAASDNTNVLTALPPLLVVHKAFLSAIQSLSPTAPATANAGVTNLVHGAGFKEG